MAELRLAPGLSFALAAVMIEPQWTAGSGFTLAYQLPSDASPGPYMEIHDGLPATVTGEADPTAVSTTIVCAPDLLTAVLAGERPAGTTIPATRSRSVTSRPGRTRTERLKPFDRGLDAGQMSASAPMLETVR